MPSGTNPGVTPSGVTPTATLNPGLQAFVDQNNQPKGQARFYALMSNGLGNPNSTQHDEWLLQQQNDPSDPEFNLMLVGAKAQASERQQLRSSFGPGIDTNVEAAIERGEKPKPPEPSQPGVADKRVAFENANRGKNPVGGKQTADVNATLAQKTSVADKRVANENTTRGKVPGEPTGQVIVGLDGKPIQSPTPSTNPTQSKDLAQSPKAGTPADIGKQVQAGGYVYIGTDPGASGVGAQGRTALNTDKYMKIDDAKDAIGGFGPDQLKAFQKMMGLPETGLPDAKTFTAWSNVVDTAERLTRNGIHMDPMSIAVAFVKNGGGGSGGGGGGGGGAGAAKFKMSDVQSLLTSVTQREIGRDPTQAEVQSFFGYFTGLAGGDTANPTQLATDWVRLNMGKEQGSYGAATTYYQAMLAVLGAGAGGGSGG
jgi:hypothetical protein